LTSQLAAFLTFTFILVITPGSTTAVVVRNTLAGGRAAGLRSAAGAALGNTTHAIVAWLGLAIVFARWPLAMTALRLAGAAYLAWLGSSSLYRVVRYADGGLRMMSDGANGPVPEVRFGSFRQGLTVNLLNPAIATFYLVVVPAFLAPGASRGYFAALAAIHITMAFVCHGLWALAFGRVRRLLRRPLARRFVEAATGVALIGLALRIVRPG
jgi:threonine/homoserine/homoserine lactone efflux protein